MIYPRPIDPMGKFLLLGRSLFWGLGLSDNFLWGLGGVCFCRHFLQCPEFVEGFFECC